MCAVQMVDLASTWTAVQMFAVSVLHPGSPMLALIGDACMRACSSFSESLKDGCHVFAGRVIARAGTLSGHEKEDEDFLTLLPLGRLVTSNPSNFFSIFSLPDVWRSCAFQRGFLKEPFLDMVIAEIMTYTCKTADSFFKYAKGQDFPSATMGLPDVMRPPPTHVAGLHVPPGLSAGSPNPALERVFKFVRVFCILHFAFCTLVLFGLVRFQVYEPS
jgi:hypothetical protein